MMMNLKNPIHRTGSKRDGADYKHSNDIYQTQKSLMHSSPTDPLRSWMNRFSQQKQMV